MRPSVKLNSAIIDAAPNKKMGVSFSLTSGTKFFSDVLKLEFCCQNVHKLALDHKIYHTMLGRLIQVHVGPECMWALTPAQKA